MVVPRPVRAALLRFAALTTVAFCLALLFTIQIWTAPPPPPRPGTPPSVAAARAAERAPRPPFQRVLFTDFLRWFGWALAAPFVIAVVRRFPIGRRNTVRNVAILVGAALPAIALRTFIVLCLAIAFDSHFQPPSFPEAFMSSIRSRFAFDSFVYVLIVAATHVGILLGEVRQRDLREANLARQLVAARLTALEAQLHPHFFFNTLHTISALLDRDTAGARRVLTRFGDMMRMLLDSNDRPRTTLQWEFAFLTCYADIQQVRFGDAVHFQFHLNDNDTALVPRLILQPLVENAVLHGVEGAGGPVTVTVEADRLDGQLRLAVTDTGTGLGHEAAIERVGLSTTRQRLRAAYGDRASLTLTPLQTGGAATAIVLPYEVDDSSRRGSTGSESAEDSP